MIEPSLQFARYYDLEPDPFDGKDITFFVSLIPRAATDILELACGTGRVLIPLAGHCNRIEGLDSSSNMLSVCREKLRAAGWSHLCEALHIGEMSDFDLGRQFDLILVPFYGFQLLLADSDISSFFVSVSKHLAIGGSCLLTAFNPWGDWETMKSDWCSMKSESTSWELTLGTSRLMCVERVDKVDSDPLACHFTLTYRCYEQNELSHETSARIALRCYRPDELEAIIRDQGFRIVDKWGGYSGEQYGEGEELIIQFSRA
jgi:SAM-dependent methyltransferase